MLTCQKVHGYPGQDAYIYRIRKDRRTTRKSEVISEDHLRKADIGFSLKLYRLTSMNTCKHTGHNSEKVGVVHDYTHDVNAASMFECQRKRINKR